MKNILLAVLLLMITYSCKKQITSEQPAEVLQAAPPCTGNTWSLTPDYPFGIEPNPIYPSTIKFVCNNKLYVVLASQPKVYIYDGVNWTWVNSDRPTTLAWAFCFSVGDKGYLIQWSNDNHRLWEYATLTNTWTEKTAFPGPSRFEPATFSIGNNGYVFGGRYATTYRRDLWRYNTVTDEWTQKASLPSSYAGRASATGFTIGNNGYIAGGYKKVEDVSYTLFNDLLSYNPILNTWSQLADYPGILGEETNSFVIGTAAYVGMDRINFYKYSSSSNSWSSIAQYPGQPYFNNSTVALNSKGYMLFGNEMYKYVPKFCGIGGFNQ